MGNGGEGVEAGKTTSCGCVREAANAPRAIVDVPVTLDAAGSTPPAKVTAKELSYNNLLCAQPSIPPQLPPPWPNSVDACASSSVR